MPTAIVSGRLVHLLLIGDDPGAEYVKYDYCETTEAIGNRADDAWLSCNPQPNPYVAERSGYHWIHYDLGQQYYLKESRVWNYNVPGQTGQGFQNVAVDYSIDGVQWYHLGTYSWSLASGENTYTGFVGPDFNDVAARYVLFTSLDSPASCRGIHKISFDVGICQDEGTPCDDDNALTYNDHIDAQCECVGYTAAELDCVKDTLFITESEMAPNTYHAMMALMSEGKVMNAADVNYKAGMEIVLDEGFEVTMGSSFEAIIEDCASPIIAAVPAKAISPGLKKPTRPEESPGSLSS